MGSLTAHLWFTTAKGISVSHISKSYMGLNHMFGLVWQSTQTVKQAKKILRYSVERVAASVTEAQMLKPV